MGIPGADRLLRVTAGLYLALQSHMLEVAALLIAPVRMGLGPGPEATETERSQLDTCVVG